MKKGLLIMMMVFLLISEGKSQDCIGNLMAALRKMRMSDSTQSLHVSYDMQTQFRKVDSLQQVRLEIYARKGLFGLLSDGMRMYQNEKFNISILDARREIYISSAQPSGFLALQQMGQVQDSLIATAEVLQCQRICLDKNFNEEEHYTKLRLSRRAQLLLSIREVEYWINPVCNEIKRFKITYTSDQNIQNLMIFINAYENPYNNSLIKDFRVMQVLNDPSLAKNLFDGFKIQDNRP